MNTREATSQFKLRTLFVVTTVVAMLLGGCLLWDRAVNQLIYDFAVGKTGPVESRDDWPEVLIALTRECPHSIEMDSVRVYCLCNGMDREYAISMEASPEVFDDVIRQWKLVKVPNPIMKRVFEGRSPLSGVQTPAWWNAAAIADITYYACPSTLEGEKGHRFQAAYTKDGNTLFIHYWFNF